MTKTEFFAERALASLCTSEDKNDQAFCAFLALALDNWKANRAENLLRKMTSNVTHDGFPRLLPSMN